MHSTRNVNQPQRKMRIVINVNQPSLNITQKKKTYIWKVSNETILRKILIC